jgi:hypothetical protein
MRGNSSAAQQYREFEDGLQKNFGLETVNWNQSNGFRTVTRSVAPTGVPPRLSRISISQRRVRQLLAVKAELKKSGTDSRKNSS